MNLLKILAVSAAVFMTLCVHAQPTTQEVFSLFELDAHQSDRLDISSNEFFPQKPARYTGTRCRLDTVAMTQTIMSEFFADGNLPAGAAAGRGLASKAAACAILTQGMEGIEDPATWAFMAGIGLFNAGRVDIVNPPKAYHERARVYLEYAANSSKTTYSTVARKYLAALNPKR